MRHRHVRWRYARLRRVAGWTVRLTFLSGKCFAGNESQMQCRTIKDVQTLDFFRGCLRALRGWQAQPTGKACWGGPIALQSLVMLVVNRGQA